MNTAPARRAPITTLLWRRWQRWSLAAGCALAAYGATGYCLIPQVIQQRLPIPDITGLRVIEANTQLIIESDRSHNAQRLLVRQAEPGCRHGANCTPSVSARMDRSSRKDGSGSGTPVAVKLGLAVN